MIYHAWANTCITYIFLYKHTHIYININVYIFWGFPCGWAGKESSCNAEDLGLIPGLRRSPGEGKGYPLQYSGLENSMDYSPWSHKESDIDWPTFTHTHTHTHTFSASFQIGFAVIAFMNIGPCKIHEKFVVCSFGIIKNSAGASPVVQWLRICLAMRRTLVWSLVGEWRLSPLMPQLENPSAATKDPMCCN